VDPASPHDQAVAACAVTGVSKRYGGVQALSGVDLEVYPGTVHAVLGENGAGKSTLMKILAGAERPDRGSIYLGGREVSLASVADANRNGVSIVFQELSLFPELEVFANLFIGREPRNLGIVSRSEMRRRALPVLEEIGLDVDLSSPVSALSLDQRQLLEIARALLQNSKVLILDEPNSALNAEESERLFTVIRRLRDRGTAILYISHRLEEVFRIADVLTVMRNGTIVGTMTPSATSIRDVVAQMIGREPEQLSSKPRVAAGAAEQRLVLTNVSVEGRLEGVNLTIGSGEIVGLAGLQGSGVETVFDVLNGITEPEGFVSLPTGRPGPRSVRAAVRAGIALIPPDRRVLGLMLDQSVMANVSEVSAGALGRFGFVLRRETLAARTVARAGELNIRMRSVDSLVNQLSGGNQQKVVIAKWLEADPQIVLLNDPTRGVDVGAKAEIYEIARRLAEENRILVFASSELSEYALLCDRVAILYQGRLCGELRGAEISEHRLLEMINTGSAPATAFPAGRQTADPPQAS
jgi:ribose transport system ATP-binding protein